MDLRPASFATACLALVLAAPALPAPLTLEDLVEFHHSGLTTEAFQALVTREGLAVPVGADAARTLQAEGFPSELVSWLITSGSPGPSGVEGIDYLVEEGVLVVSGEGEAADDEIRYEPPPPMSTPVVEPAPPTVIVVAPPGPQQPIIVPSYGGYGSYGASWGWTSVAEVPARFGDETSAFGTTIVNVAGTGGCGFVAPLGFAVGRHSGFGTVPVHTSRGTLYLPN